MEPIYRWETGTRRAGGLMGWHEAIFLLETLPHTFPGLLEEWVLATDPASIQVCFLEVITSNVNTRLPNNDSHHQRPIQNQNDLAWEVQSPNLRVLSTQ